MAYSIDFEAFQLHRLLRKNSIDAAVTVGKAIISLLLLTILTFLVYSAVSTYLDTRAALNKLDADIKALPSGQPAAAITDKAKHDYAVIAANKMFGELGIQAVAQPTPVAKSANRLSLELIGTFLSGGQAPYAIIEDQKKKIQDVFMVNDPIFGEAKLLSIYSDRVEVEQNGEKEILKLDNTPDESVDMKDGVAVVGDNQYLVEEAELDKALENLPLLLTQARAVPYFKEGKAIGLRMFAIRSGSIFEKIGLKNGDILKSINGSSMGDLTQAMKLFEKLKQERSLALTLERNNADAEYKYQIK